MARVASVDLEREQNIERLRTAALVLEAENRRLVSKVMELTRALSTAHGEDARLLQLRISELEEQLARSAQALFGSSSEKRPGGGAGPPAAKLPQRGHGPKSQPALPLVERIHTLEAPDTACASCGGVLQTWAGQFEESEEVHVVERKFVLVQHRRQKYRCVCGGCVETAPAPLKLFEGARYSIDFAIEVAVQKYLDHLPLERQVRIFHREGLEVDSQTLWDYLERLARLLAPAYAQLHAFQLAQPVLGADETRWPLLGAPQGERSKWHTWALSSPLAAYYGILDSRSTEAAKVMLNGYAGVVVVDGYSVYQALQLRGGSFTLAHCWSHVRREFFAAREKYPGADIALDFIGELYAIERECETGPPGLAERQRLRTEKSAAIIGRLHAWALEQRVLPESALGKALAYMAGLWPGLLRFLHDARIPLDNNATERALRGPVIGRKNHHGSRSRRGTEVAALIYSLVETAKLNDVEPKAYLRRAVHAALANKPLPLPHALATSALAGG